MDTRMQLKVVMLGRLQGFLRANPLGDEPADQVVARFTEKMDRLRVLAAQQRAGLVAQAAENRTAADRRGAHPAGGQAARYRFPDHRAEHRGDGTGAS